jgi:hypothetical protein
MPVPEKIINFMRSGRADPSMTLATYREPYNSSRCIDRLFTLLERDDELWPLW